MKTTNCRLIILLNLGVGLLVITPFFPGPYIGITNQFYNGGQIIGLFGIVLTPIGLIWTIKELRKKRSEEMTNVDRNAIILLTLPLTLFITTLYLSEYIRDFSRNFAIDRTKDLVRSIENFKEINGAYPETLTDLTPNFISQIPSPLIMGIDNFHYKKRDDAFNISFYQNKTLGFNYEVVTYDPTDNHAADGELLDIYDTGRIHWKYYVYD